MFNKHIKIKIIDFIKPQLLTIKYYFYGTLMYQLGPINGPGNKMKCYKKLISSENKTLYTYFVIQGMKFPVFI